MQLACGYLDSLRRQCVIAREPGGTEIGEKIRDMLLLVDNGAIHNECEALLYCVARAQLVRERIFPALERGAIVLCDRFAEATFAYQGFGRGLPLGALEAINDFAAHGLQPSQTFVFDISVEQSTHRLKKSGKTADRMEGSGREFYERVREDILRSRGKPPTAYGWFPEKDRLRPLRWLYKTVCRNCSSIRK